MTETRRGEIRSAPGRRLIGVAMRYGSEARGVWLPDGTGPLRERFAAFAFAEYRGETRLNMMHDPSITLASTRGGDRGNLVLRDGPEAMRMVATLPAGDAYDAALALVADGSTAETSVEFVARREKRSGDRRTVLQADLPGIALVDLGAYGRAGVVEARRSFTLRASVARGAEMDCECAGRRCFRALVDEFTLPDPGDEGRDVLAVAGEYRQPLASWRRGGLRLNQTDAALEVDMDLPATPAGDAVREAAAVAPIYARPYLSTRLSEYVDRGTVRHYQTAAVRAIIVGVADRAAGLEPARLVADTEEDEPARRRRVWL